MFDSSDVVDSSRLTLVLGGVAVFSKTAAVATGICLENAGRHASPLDGGMGDAVGRGRYAVDAAEARRERADAAQTDGEADVGHGAIGVAQQRGRALEPACEEILVRRLAESSPKFPAEVRRREVGGAGKRRHVERLAEARVRDVLRTQQMPFGR